MKYIIRMNNPFYKSISGHGKSGKFLYLESHARTPIWKPEKDCAKTFTSLKEANEVSKKYGGEVVLTLKHLKNYPDENI